MLINAKDFKGAWNLFQDMKQNNITPRSSVYTILLTACAHEKKLIQGKELIEDLKGNLPLNIYHYNAILNLYAQCGDLNTAISYLSTMEKNQIRPDNVSYTTLLAGCAQHSNSKVGKKIYQQMVDQKIRMDTILYNALIMMFAKSGEMLRATQLLQDMPLHQTKPNVNTYNILIAESLDTNHALTIFQMMKAAGIEPTVEVYTSLLAVCAEHADKTNGERFHKEIIQKGLKMTVPLSTTLIKFYSRIGQLDTCLQIFQVRYDKPALINEMIVDIL
jgi:pentatricopeptide repeat protein